LAIGLKIAPEGDIVMEIHRRVGECHFLEGSPGQAMPELNKGLEMARAQGDRFEAAVTLRVMSDTSLEVGDLKSARAYIDESVDILREIDARHELAISLMKSADLTLQEMDNGRSGMPRLAQLNEAWNLATGALDLFIRVDVPWWTSKSRSQVGRIAKMRTAQERADKESKAQGKPGSYEPGDVIIHTSGQMRDLLHLCDMFADSGDPVLVHGETGTGKELIARRIHLHSKRADKNLVTVNVAAIPQTMFEREFFGHVKGAFSGAQSDGEGYAARANGGTLFLDEIGDLPLEAQPKLLRLLQEGTYQAIGDPRERRTDIRLVAATNSNMQKLVNEGKFRSDLYYRIKILDLELPAVRDRSEDILPLMRHFLSEAAKKHVDAAQYFNQLSIEAIENYNWPGNVREIAMVARRAHMDLKSRGRVEITIPQDKASPLVLTGPGLLAKMEAAAGGSPGLNTSDAAERSRLLMALDEAGGNRNAAARALGVGRSTLYRRMVKFGIPTRRT
jgi:transcriptional regulator with GAF, ATPase, and Fis domain